MSAPLARITVGIVVERRRSASPWVDFTWQPVSILPGEPQTPAWTVLSSDAQRTRFYAGAAEVNLYRTETAQYRDNLLSGAASLWVVLRPTGVQPAFDLIAVTADPAEGEAFTQTGSDLVEALPMPAVVREFVEAFVFEHHVEQTFVKRQRDRADPEALARRPPIVKNR